MRILSALSGIAPSAQTVHGHGQGAMRLRAEGAEGHGLRRKPAKNRTFVFHLFERHCLAGSEVQQVAHGHGGARLRQLRERAVILARRPFDIPVQPAHNLGRRSVTLPVLAEAVEASVAEHARAGRKRGVMAFQGVFEKRGKWLRSEDDGRILKKFRTDVFVNSHQLEQAAVAIAGQAGDPHAGQDLAQARLDGQAIALRTARAGVLRQLQSQEWMNGARPGSGQQGHVVGFDYLAGLDDQREFPGALAHHRVPGCSHGEKRGERGAVSGNAAVREQNHPAASASGLAGNAVECGPCRSDSPGCFECEIHPPHRAEEFQPEAVHLLRIEQWRWEKRAAAQMHIERHHMRFPQGINRRIGHLGKALFAVVPQRPPRRGEKSGGSIVAHAPHGFFALRAQRQKEHPVLVFGPSVGRGDALRLLR